MIELSQCIKKLIAQCNLSEGESYTLFENFKDAPIAQQAAILALLTTKGVTIPELNGALRFFLAQATTVHYPHPVIDIVGTGGDGLGTFNISTAASMVVASRGVAVAKHGGRASTSKSGSVDVIEHLGIPLYDDSSKIIASLDKHHYAYLCGPFFNPLLKSLRNLRRSLGFQTLLNILSPMANPMRPSKLVIGVYRKDLVRKLAEVLLSFGKEHAIIVHSEDGLDEFSVSSTNHVAEFTSKGIITEYSITPEQVGLRRSPLSEVIGGTPAENAEIIRGIFRGEITDAKLDIVLFNAASGFVVAGVAADLAQGVILARDQIESGKAYALLNDLKNEVIMSHFLDKIRKSTLNRLAYIKTPENQTPNCLDFNRIFITHRSPIIAEIKFASPSHGTIYKEKCDPIDIASQYLKNGAAALSVLTEPEYFKGNIQFIADIRKRFPQTPILLKDFVLSELQIRQALEYGANAVLLIVAFLEPARIQKLYSYALSLSLTPLVEISNLAEMTALKSLNPKVIIINNRNLKTQQVDLRTSGELISHIVSDAHVISASGIENGRQLKALRELGFHGFLVGTTLMKHQNPGNALNQLLLEANDED